MKCALRPRACQTNARPGVGPPPAQWKSRRTTNAIEPVFGEFRRRVKTQGALPSPEAILTMLWGTLAGGGIRRRKLDGYRTMAEMTRRQAA